MIGPRHRVFFGGDTGYTEAFAEIARRWGPFDITVLPIGAYSPYWPDIHLNPEEAVAALRARGFTARRLEDHGCAAIQSIRSPLSWFSMAELVPCHVPPE